jgi:hypothetical protein
MIGIGLRVLWDRPHSWFGGQVSWEDSGDGQGMGDSKLRHAAYLTKLYFYVANAPSY